MFTDCIIIKVNNLYNFYEWVNTCKIILNKIVHYLKIQSKQALSNQYVCYEQ